MLIRHTDELTYKDTRMSIQENVTNEFIWNMWIKIWQHLSPKDT